MCTTGVYYNGLAPDFSALILLSIEELAGAPGFEAKMHPTC